MSRILVLSTDLPYFPGKNGHDFFNIRFLAERHRVAVVGPRYDFAPAEGIRNLENAVEAVIAWPSGVSNGVLFVRTDAGDALKGWVHRLPKWLRRRIHDRLLGIHRSPADAMERLAILSNCAPHLLKAMEDSYCKSIVLIQSNLEPFLNFLPGPGSRIVYFHDVRTDYLARMLSFSGGSQRRAELRKVRAQESAACGAADAVGFVSELDLARARHLFKLPDTLGVAPIPVDTTYFTPAPAGWERANSPAVLFTGHLSHPPNIDAIKFFLAEIWPMVTREVPDARFVAAGLLPGDELRQLASTTPGFELHANVPDIRPFFWNANVYVVPMRFGGGVRQKIFEAWSMKVPVVCTSMAVEGIAARHGENCWLEDSTSGFATRVVELLRSGTAGDAPSTAKEQVEATNSIPVAAKAFTTLVEKGIAAGRRRAYRLLFDLRWMELGVSGGTEQMTHELIAAISQIDHHNHFRMFCPSRTFHEWRFPRGFNVKIEYSDESEAARERLSSTAANRLAERLGLPPVLTPAMRSLRALKRLDFDLVHSVPSYIHPDLEAFPQILTVHDLQHRSFPEFFSGPGLEERDRIYRRAVEKAAHIIAISEFTRRDIHRQYGVPLEKITTIWNIPSRHVWHPLAQDVRARLLKKMGINTPYFFFPGHCWMHKNHARLVDAYAAVRSELPGGMKLIFAGGRFPEDHPAGVRICDLGLASDVIHLGYRSPLEIQALYQGCRALVFPSLFEGFGMPVAEAIIAGKPVACSNCTSLPEIAGDAAIVFNPTDVNDIASSLLRIATDAKLHSELAAASVRRRTHFSSRESAIKTLAVYQRVYEEIYA